MTTTWTTQSGHDVRIDVQDSIGTVVAAAYLDGKLVRRGLPQLLRAPQTISGQRIVATLGPLGLPQERYDAVVAMLGARQAEIDSTPDGMMRKLLAERETLARAVGYILDAEHDEHQERIEQMSATGCARAVTRDYKAEEAAARTALAAFDAAHPEVVVALQAAKAERIHRAMAN